MIAREDDHKFKKGKCMLRGRTVCYMGAPDGFGPGFLGWDASKPTAHPRLHYNVTFQKDARIDRHMEENMQLLTQTMRVTRPVKKRQ